MRIRIVSDGTVAGTHVYDVEEGKEIKDICSLTYHIDVENASPTLHLCFVNKMIEIDTIVASDDFKG